MELLVSELPIGWIAGLFFVLGGLVGGGLVKCIDGLVGSDSLLRRRGCVGCGSPFRWWQRLPIAGFVVSRGQCSQCGRRLGGWILFVELATGLLFAAFVTAMLHFECQKTGEVRPDEVWRYGRLLYHLVLMCLLIVATGTDFREYVIFESVTLTGMLFGVVGATLSGDLQMIHLWVDWNDPTADVFGPYLPEWLVQYRHWHGLAWSVAGLAVGGGITWLVRELSSLLLGREALGFGDVMLMAMIGSFIGWQPVTIVFLLAPLCGIVVGLSVRLFTGRMFVPYGPYLSAATVAVLFGWKWIWLFEIHWTLRNVFSIRKLFGDWPSLVILAGIALVAFVLLLGLLRLYRWIPVQTVSSVRRSKPTSHQTEPTRDKTDGA